MAGAFAHAVAVVEIKAAVEGACAHGDFAGNLCVMGDDGGHKGALAFVSQRDGVVEIAVAHEGGDRTKGFRGVYVFCGIR